jgi:hypothetical protein
MKKIIEGKHIIVFASIVVVMLLGLVSMICYFYTDKLYHINHKHYKFSKK